MNFKDYYKKELVKSPKLRKAKYNMQWDGPFLTSCIAQNLRIGAGLTQKQMSKKTGIPQPSLARAESSGCSITMLSKIAKAVGKKIVLTVEDPELLTNPL